MSKTEFNIHLQRLSITFPQLRKMFHKNATEWRNFFMFFFYPIYHCYYYYLLANLGKKETFIHNPCAQLGGERGGDLPCPFLKIKKSALILEKKVLILSILRSNLPFKMQF